MFRANWCRIGRKEHSIRRLAVTFLIARIIFFRGTISVDLALPEAGTKN